jgi:hypothetical protein
MADWIPSTLEDGALPGAGTGRFEAVRFGDWARLSSGLTQRIGHKVSRSEGRRRIVVCCGWPALTSTWPENISVFDAPTDQRQILARDRKGFLRHESGSEISVSRNAKGRLLTSPAGDDLFRRPRPSYPLAGCSSAEPASVSLDDCSITDPKEMKN